MDNELLGIISLGLIAMAFLYGFLIGSERMKRKIFEDLIASLNERKE
jgi:hypothetical protein